MLDIWKSVWISNCVSDATSNNILEQLQQFQLIVDN